MLVNLALPVYNQALSLKLDSPNPGYYAPAIKDSFESIANAVIKPTGQDCYTVSAKVAPTGRLFRRGLDGVELLGQIDTQGNYRLVNNMCGNFFVDKKIDLLGWAEQQNSFSTALKAGALQRAIAGSEIPLIRTILTSKGINGQGISVGILDPQEKNKKTGAWGSSNHTKVVTQIINDPFWGVAPGSRVVELGEQWEASSEIPSDNYQVFVDKIASDYTHLFTSMNGEIQKTLFSRDPSLRVLNVTHGASRFDTYQDIWQQLHAQDADGYFKFPALRSAIFGSSLYTTPKEQFAAVVRTVDSILDTSPVARQAQQSYIAMTRQAAASGLIIVQAVANSHNALPFDVLVKPGNEMNECAKSPYVIAVAAADTNQQPGNRGAYKIAPYSSRGDGTYNPTIATPGSEMGISFPVGTIGHGHVVDGTSFSTPFTCGIIALMLQRNPLLTFEQVKAKLQATAVPLSGYTPAEQGAGILNSELAVLS